MEVIRKLEDIRELGLPSLKPVVTIGSFDGVHLGHQHLLSVVKEKAAAIGGVSVVITFHPHPQQLLRPGAFDFFAINSVDEKIKLIEEAGIDYLIIIPFTWEFASLSFAQFIKDILVSIIGIKMLVMGPNNTFGKGRQGNAQTIQQICCEENIIIVVVSELKIEGKPVRSQRIRQLIRQQNSKGVEELLGHD
ncbi:MAG: FAD synthetase family protein [Bacteroidales bacterium]|jgi:riboflavin kinase/FMN adenylyltransferase|nr:FAD synthetase family protein [Bacteroidales bacterium]